MWIYRDRWLQKFCMLYHNYYGAYQKSGSLKKIAFLSLNSPFKELNLFILYFPRIPRFDLQRTIENLEIPHHTPRINQKTFPHTTLVAYKGTVKSDSDSLKRQWNIFYILKGKIYHTPRTNQKAFLHHYGIITSTAYRENIITILISYKADILATIIFVKETQL